MSGVTRPGRCSHSLPDGRKLSYYELGDPNGRPVLLFHGTPSCAASWLFAAEPARELGVRALAIDRPGVGYSSPKRGRRVADWPRDVASFADALELQRFAVLGWSGGGPYALACAAALPERVSATGVAAGVCPASWPGALDALGDDDRRWTRLSVHAPWLLQGIFAAMVFASRKWPERALEAAAGSFAPADRELLKRHQGSPYLLEPFIEAFAQGTRGPVDDYRTYAQPWGFAVEDVRVPVTIWHGDADATVRILHAELLAKRLPDASLHVLQGSGHMFPIERIRDLLAALV